MLIYISKLFYKTANRYFLLLCLRKDNLALIISFFRNFGISLILQVRYDRDCNLILDFVYLVLNSV